MLQLLHKCQTVLKVLYKRQSCDVYFMFLRTKNWRTALVHERDLWSSKHNLSSWETPDNLSSVEGCIALYIVLFDIFNSKVVKKFDIIVSNFEVVAMISFLSNLSEESLPAALISFFNDIHSMGVTTDYVIGCIVVKWGIHSWIHKRYH